MSKATIKDLKVDPKAKATSEMKRAFEKILIDEYANQTATLNAQKTESEISFLMRWKKSKGVDKLVAKYCKFQAEMKSLESLINDFGFKTNGDKMQYGAIPDDLSVALDEIGKKYSAPRTELNKMKARVWCEQTVGGLLVILQDITGNGIIPSFTNEEMGNVPQIEQ